MHWDLVRSILLGATVLAVAVWTVVPVWDPAWWATNEDPPKLSIDGAFGPLRGVAEAQVEVDPADRTTLVSATVDGRPAKFNGSKVVVNTTQLPDGVHQVTVFARDRSLHGNENAAIWVFLSINAPPNISVELDPTSGPVVGRTTVVHARADRPTVSAHGTVDGNALDFQPDGRGGFWSVLGVPPSVQQRTLAYHVEATDEAGNPASVNGSWTIQPAQGTPLAVGAEQSDSVPTAPQNLQSVFAATGTPKQWDGPFKLPVKALPNNGSGTPRSTRSVPQVDFNVNPGSTIDASADGMVVLVDTTALAGPILAIDHGASVVTVYRGDVATVEVVPGQTVKGGQEIGRVGPGNQLHWELFIHGVDVDPVEWTQRQFP